MEKLLFILLVTSSVISFGQGRTEAKQLSEKLTPRFANDNGSLGTSYLFQETNPNGFDLLSANISFSDKNQTQKIGFSPLRLSTKYLLLLSNLRINLSNTSGALTTGLSIGNDNSAFESNRVQNIFTDIYSKGKLPDSKLPVARARRADETLKEYMEYYNTSPEMKEFQDKLLTEFDNLRLKHVFKYSVGYSIQFFPILKSVSATGNFDSLNYHSLKANNYFAKGSYSFNNGFININGAYNYFQKRKAADSTQQKKRYDGFTIGGTIRIPLIKKENLIKKDFYKNNLFIPGIYVGFIYDRLSYKGSEAIFAEENTKWKHTWTITLDFVITPAAQFRLAFPIQKSEIFNTNTKLTNNIAILQYNFKLVNLNDN
jgi:hypothetical protein